MHFVVHALDKPDALPRRLEVVAEHRGYLQTATTMTIPMSGPLTEDDGETMKGSFFLIDAPDRATIEAFFAEDPLAKADIWQTLQITAFNLRVNTFVEA